ncbi:MAG TPA: metal-sensitive transcriptional regulator, partial [Acidimicrobiia bacterium]
MGFASSRRGGIVTGTGRATPSSEHPGSRRERPGSKVTRVREYTPRGISWSLDSKHEERAMQIPDNVIDDVRKRLRRAAGQVQAVERMLAEGRECREVVTQISAA